MLIINKIKQAAELLENNQKFGDLKEYSNVLVEKLAELKEIEEYSINVKKKLVGEIKFIDNTFFVNQINDINIVVSEEMKKTNEIKKLETTRIKVKYNLLNKILVEKWREYIEIVSHDANNTLLLFEKTNLLDSVSLNKLKYLKRSVDNLQPNDSNVNDIVNSYSEEIKKRVSEMQIDETIQDFLYKIISGNATVQDMNNDIFEWIKKQSMGSHFKVQIKEM